MLTIVVSMIRRNHHHLSLFLTEPKKPSKVVQIEVDDSDIKGRHTQHTSPPISTVLELQLMWLQH